jgi:thiol-disulfide isomerase/thioredoxin
MTGLIALIAALAAASVAGVVFRRRAGRFSVTSQDPRPDTLTSADLGAELGARATLVQFSTEFCAYCGPTRRLLGEVAAARPGVAVIEIDAAERMDLTRRLRVLATPTVLVLGPDGAIVSRSSGQPKKAAVLDAVGTVS